MTDVASMPTVRTNGTTPRTVARRRPLPGGRAVVGGFLVAASAAGVFASWSAASDGPAGRYAVVTADVAAGETIDRRHLELVAIDLPDSQRRVAFEDLDLLVGATALAPLADGQLVQSSDVAKPVGAPSRAQLSLRIDRGAAVGGDLRAGDRIDVIVTYTSGGEPVTTTISRDAVVVRVIDDDARVGSGGAIVVVLAVRPAELEPIASAAAAGEIMLARTTGMSGR